MGGVFGCVYGGVGGGDEKERGIRGGGEKDRGGDENPSNGGKKKNDGNGIPVTATPFFP